MNKKMITEYLKTIIFAVVASVVISLLLCYLFFFSGIGEDKNNPEYWIQSMNSYVSYENDSFVVDDKALSMLQGFHSWIQILDENGYIVYSKYVPDEFPIHLSNLDVLNNLLGVNNIPGYTLYAIELTEYPGYGILIGCDSEVVSKYSITVAGNGTVLVLRCALVFLITMIVVITYVSFRYSKKITEPVTKVLTDIEKISEGKNIEIEKKESIFSGVFLRLQKLSHLLRENEHMRNTWIVNISHDIKTPLSTVRGYAELLSSDSYELDKNEVQYFASEILKSEAVIEGLVEDLSISHRLAEGKMVLQVAPISINELLRETVETVGACGLDIKQITLISDDISVIDGDRKLLKRSLVNIICNALVHNDTDVSVNVRAQVCEDKVFLIIEDNGRGVSEEELDHLFDRYYRGTNTTNIQGTGLGLAIAKEVVLAHGGFIEAELSASGGLRFILTLRRKL